MAQRIIQITGEMNYEALASFAESFRELDAKSGTITVSLTSGGGAVDVGLAMYDLIRTSKNPVITLGMGEVASMAVLVLQAGDWRLVTEGSGLMVHDGSIHLETSTLKAKSMMDQTMRLHRQYCLLIAKRTGLSEKTVTDMASQEFFMTSHKAYEYGLVDDILLHKAIRKVR
jgi:ATP-dependent Clp protease, protease subunit